MGVDLIPLNNIMASFAKLDNNNIVIDVLKVSNEVIQNANALENEELGVQFLKSLYGQDTNWKQTSASQSFRKRFAGIGFSYDSQRDAFIPPKVIYKGQVCNSWILNESTYIYEAPVSFPETYNLNLRGPNNELLKDTYTWNESALTWDLDTNTN
jgi:hypothetical protein